MTDLSPESRSVIDASREQEGPDAQARERMRAKLATTVGAAFALPLGAGLVRTLVAKASAASLATKVIVASAVVVSAAVVARKLESPSPTASTAVTRPQSRPILEQTARPHAPTAAQPASESDAAALAITVAEDAGSPSSIDRARTRPSSIERESALIARADRALRDGQPASALVLVEEHRSQFTRGQLARERDALEVLALCDVGRPQRAQQAMSRLDLRELAPALRQRLASSCATVVTRASQ